MSLITVTCTMGTGGSRIAERVARGLGLDFYDDMKFEDEARKAGISPEDLAHLRESPPGFWGYIWRDEPDRYLDLMESVVYDLAQNGKAVIVGHAGQMLLKDFHCALHVMVCAPEEYRIDLLVNEHGLSRELAEKLIRNTDRAQQGFYRFAFHRDLHDPSLFDLILNTEKLKEDAAVEIIMKAASSDTIQECSRQALDSMEKLSLDKRIDAALLKHGLRLTRFHVEVPEKGVVRISGVGFSEDEREDVLSLVKQVPGVTKVQSEIVIVPRQQY
jgi:cytidylate kinase